VTWLKAIQPPAQARLAARAPPPYAHIVHRALPLLLLTAACAHDPGGWPSLAPRAAELRRLDQGATATLVAEAPPEPPQAPPRAADPAAPRDWARMKPRVAPVQAALDRAMRTASSARAGSTPWADAQIELSRAEQLAGDLDDIAERFGGTAESPRAPADLAADRADLARRIAQAKALLAR